MQPASIPGPLPDPRGLLPLVLLWLAGLYLRLPVLAAPPLALDIARDLDLGQADIGALTTLPLVMVALGALPAAWLMQRIGLQRALLAGLVVMAAMSAARGLADGRFLLFGATVAMGLGIAIVQTVLPSVVGAWTPSRLGLGTAAYMNGMMVGEFAGAGLTLPLIVPLAGGDWRQALLLWSLPVAGIVALLAVGARGARSDSDTSGHVMDRAHGGAQTPSATHGTDEPRALWRDATAWRLGVPLGGSVIVFYAINAYMGSVLDARGESASLAGLLLAFNLAPFAASVLLLVFARHWTARRGPLVASAALAVAGLLGFVLLPGPAGQACAVIASFAATLELILLVSLPPGLVHGAAVGRLSAAMTTIGYGIAFLVPLAGGLLADRLGAGVTLVLIPSFACAAVAVLPLVKLRTRPGSG